MNTTNNARAGRAEFALLTYILGKGEVFEGCLDEISDLIADLLHLAAKYANDDGNEPEDYIDQVIRMARLHFDAEHNNPEEEAA